MMSMTLSTREIDGCLKCTPTVSALNLVDSRVSGRVAIAREPRRQRLPRRQKLSVRSARRAARAARDGARGAHRSQRAQLAAARVRKWRACTSQRQRQCQLNLT